MDTKTIIRHDQKRAGEFFASVSKKKISLSEESTYWIDDWVNADVLDKSVNIGKPGARVVKEFSSFKPDKPVKLYRGVRPNQGLGSSTGYESWSYNKHTAKGFAEGGTVIERLVKPEEILVDFTKVPAAIRREHGAWDLTEKEVIVKMRK